MLRNYRVGKTVVRRSRAWIAISMLMALPALAGCGLGQARAAGAASHRSGASVTADKPLSQADLERAAVAAKDLDGYEVLWEKGLAEASHSPADPAVCAPVVQALRDSSAYTPIARSSRMISSKKDGPGADMSLSSYSAEDAVRVIGALRTAAKRCKTFKDVEVDFGYEGVEVLPDPGYGDEAVSLRFTQLAADMGQKPVKVPFAVVAVRQGTTVAMFYTFRMPSLQGKGPAVVPDAVIRAQMDKLNKSM